MRHCPSMDWDRYIQEQDSAVEAEMAWWEAHGDRVLQVVCAAVASGHTVPVEEMDAADRKQLIECAQKLVDDIVTMKGGY